MPWRSTLCYVSHWSIRVITLTCASLELRRRFYFQLTSFTENSLPRTRVRNDVERFTKNMEGVQKLHSTPVNRPQVVTMQPRLDNTGTSHTFSFPPRPTSLHPHSLTYQERDRANLECPAISNMTSHWTRPGDEVGDNDETQQRNTKHIYKVTSLSLACLFIETNIRNASKWALL